VILVAWFDHGEERFSCKEVQFKTFCPQVKTSCPVAENINETPGLSLVDRRANLHCHVKTIVAGRGTLQNAEYTVWTVCLRLVSLLFAYSHLFFVVVVVGKDSILYFVLSNNLKLTASKTCVKTVHSAFCKIPLQHYGGYW